MDSITGRRWRLIADGSDDAGLTLEARLRRAYPTSAEEGFFTPSMERDCADPTALAGMDAAVERLERALRDDEKIAIFGDYDVDGMTGAAVLAETLRALGGQASTMVPNRLTEGYGLSTAAIDAMAAHGATVLITADCGIGNRAEIRHASERGIDVIVCDHHEIPDDVPDTAIALLHPGQAHCLYPFKHLTGVGVAAKLCHALLRRMAPAEADARFAALLDLVALGTLADQGRLTGENRFLVHAGLARLSRRERPGVRALLESAKVMERVLTEEQVHFAIAPRLNAAGRMEDPKVALRLLLATDPAEAAMLAGELERLNNLRKKRTAEIQLDLWKELDRMPPDQPAVVLAHPGWSVGLLGLLASRVAERVHRPVVLLEDRGDTLVGSARSVPGFDVHAALLACQDLFLKFGGHAQAAGLTIAKANLPAFRDRFMQVCRSTRPTQSVPELALTTRLFRTDLVLGSASLLRRFGPFGQGHASPVFLIEAVERAEVRTMGDGSHVRVGIQFPGSIETYSLTAFGWGQHYDALKRARKLDAAVTLGSSTWMGRERLELRVVDLRSVGG